MVRVAGGKSSTVLVSSGRLAMSDFKVIFFGSGRSPEILELLNDAYLLRCCYLECS